MFRSRFSLFAHRLCRQKAYQDLKNPLLTRSHAFQQPRLSAAPVRRVAVWAGSLGGISLLAAYLFWPDPSRSAPTYAHVALSPAHFTPVTVTATEQCKDPNTRLMTFTVPRESIPPIQPGDTLSAPIWSIFIKDDDIQVERPYTPLEGIDEEGRMRFWVKKYPKGEVGRWLHSKRTGDKIEIRGPLKTWPWQERLWDEVIMVGVWCKFHDTAFFITAQVSGGTGITPFYQLLHSTLFAGRETPSKTRFTLLHSSRTPGELPPPEILQPLLSFSAANPGRLSVRLFIDELDGSSSESASTQDLQVGRIGKAAVHRALDHSPEPLWWQSLLRLGRSKSTPAADRKVLFLVCGPDS